MFSRHFTQVIDVNGVEVRQPVIKDFVLYNAVQTGLALTKCLNYYRVPTEVTSGVHWVSKTGSDANAGTKASPWKTLIKADLSGTTNNTIYIKTGTYLENVGGNYWVLNKTMSYKFIGLCTITSTWDRVVRLASGNSTIEGMVIDGTNTMAFGLDIYSVGSKVSTLSRCLIKRATTNLINGGTAIETLSFVNCVFIGQKNAVRTTQGTKVSSPSINTCYFANTLINLENIDCAFTNNKFNENDKANCVVVRTALNFTGIGNNLTFVNNGIIQSDTYASAKAIIFNYNRVNQNTTTTGLGLNFSGTVNIRVKSNIFNSKSDTSGSCYFINTRSSIGYTTEIDSNIMYSKSVGNFIHIIAYGQETKIRNNYSWSNSLSNSTISLGAEASGINENNNSIITGNRIIGWRIENPSRHASTHHLFVGGGINVITANNYCSDGSLGIVVKTGSSAQPYRTGGVFNNIIQNCSVGIWARGVDSLKIYNNTISSFFLQNGILCDENSAIVGTQNSSNCIAKNNIITTSLSTGNLYNFDAASSGCIGEYSSLNGGLNLLAGSVNYTSLATAQAASKLLNCVVQNPSLSTELIPESAIIIGQNLGSTFEDALSTATTWGSMTSIPTIVTIKQPSSGLWQIGAFKQ